MPIAENHIINDAILLADNIYAHYDLDPFVLLFS